jgi:hypothetical protein
VLCVVLAGGCGGGAEVPHGAPRSQAPGGECRKREVRAPNGFCECPPSDVLCATRGFSHFTISNPEGSGLPNEASYEVEQDLVTDLVTGLVWEAAPSPEPMGWEDAKARCAALELGGRDDFRLPGRIELVTLLDFDELPIIASAFENVVPDYHFSSSPAPVGEGSAYSVYFGAGETTIASSSPGRGVARCVAGSVSHPAGEQFVAGALGVTDRVTGLVWEPAFGSASSFDAAEARCRALGSRLPSIRELQSIVDENRYEPALDPDVFPSDAGERCWSLSFRDDTPWYVDFADGKTYADVLPDELLVSRCVR